MGKIGDEDKEYTCHEHGVMYRIVESWDYISETIY